MSISPVVFLDRDGTINVDRGYVHTVSDFEYIPGAVQGMRTLCDAGYRLIVVTNQSGIAQGIFSEEEFQELSDWMVDNLLRSGVRISAVYHCPHHPDFTGSCDCRKPKLGMFWQAIEDFDINLKGSWAVGDNARDLSICAETPCKGILIGEGEAPEGCKVASSLIQAARIIVNEKELR